ncbi:phosphomannomutase/phosphoglucomutase [Candidatus Kaiserbacteria bacterium]|nr:phosphomannomutase/phosphoglucomutase [Candidatus Kaiserbacteria bacterium]
MQLKRTMFREYDIRGKEGDDELNVRSIYHIARAFGMMLKQRSVESAVVGHDARVTSESFHHAAIQGLTDSGIEVVDIGTVTTPMGYWAQYHFDIKGLCMVTASHNPSGWNGVKLGTGLSKTLLPAEVQELYGIIEKEAYAKGAIGGIRKEDITDAYMEDLVGRVHLMRPLKVLVNTGNGTGGKFAPELLRRAGASIIEHLTNIDPTYPHYTANPDGTAMMKDTGSQTVKNTCDIGLAFDGDCDRLGVVDEKGNTIWPERYLMLLARAVLEKQPGAKIIFDVKVSEALPEYITAHGGVPIMARTGHSFIRSKLIEENAALAGEGSGHIFYAQDFYSFDDAFFAALKLLEYVSKQSMSLSELIVETPYYFITPTIQIATTDEEKYAIVEKLTAAFKKDGYRVIDISGARVYMEDGWGLIRASSNTPTLVLRFEAKTQEGLDRIMAVFKQKMSQFPSLSTDWNTSGN